ncbi:MAG: Wzz/FepE/Etk N-terminal domain-containing protein [Acidithiobacillus sp.]
MTDQKPPYTIPSENGDEISLHEIYQILRQKRVIIIVTTVLFAAVAGAYSFIRPANYAYQACASMGIIGRDSHGQPIFIDSPQGAIAQLDHAYIPTVLDSRRKKVVFNVKDLKAFSPKYSSMVCITTDAPKHLGDVISQIQNTSLQLLVNNNKKMSAVSNASAESQIKELQARAKTISISGPNIKADEGAKLKELQARAKTILTDVSNNLDQERAVASQLELINTKDSVIKKQIARIKKEMSKMQPLVANGANGVHSNSTALTMMIQNNQIAQEQQQLFNLEMELSVALPNERTALLNQLKSLKRKAGDLGSQAATNSAQIEATRAALNLKEGDLSSQAATNSAQLKLAQVSLKALQITHVVRPSSPSIEPVGPGKGVFIVLGALMGLMLSVFYVLLAHALTPGKPGKELNTM